ncbi:MAG: spermine synthase [Marinilabiliales bacterium]|nr:MAG: spermine synthase [Marinilabiliales bacterium]
MKRKIVSAVVLMGFSGLVAQIVLLRELMVAFHGNELSIGVVLANWMLLEAAGAFFLGRRIAYSPQRRLLFIGVTVLFSLFFPAAVYCARVFKEFLDLVPGEGLGIMPMFYVSFLILLPVSVMHGALFTAGCRLYSQLALPGREGETGGQGTVQGEVKNGEQDAGHDAGRFGGRGDDSCGDNDSGHEAGSIASVYIYETVGTLVGGLVLTYLLIPHLHSVKIAVLTALFNFAVCAWLLKPFRSPAASFADRGGWVVLSALILLSGNLVFMGGADRLHENSVNRQWRGQNVVHYQNSHYGNIVVVESMQEYTFFSDGLPVITTPNPDIVFIEEFVHFPMLSHPDPREILVLSGGAGGVVSEILKHGVHRVDYAEVDPLIPEVIGRFPTSLTNRELGDERVKVRYADGRFFLKRTEQSYDLIFSGFTDPSSLQSNRFFTREFFSIAESKLSQEGLFVLALPGSLTYMSPELAVLNGLVLATLEDVFNVVRVIPGDGINLYLASSSVTGDIVDAGTMMERATERGITFSLITPGYLEYRLHERWLEWFSDNLGHAGSIINRDFRPLGVFYSLVWWNEKFSPSFNRIFRQSEGISVWMMSIVFLVLTGLALAYSSRLKQPLRPALSVCIVSTGFAGMLFDLILIFAFQVMFGYIFYWLGLLVTAFMAGVAAGGIWMARRLKSMDSALPGIIRLEMLIILFALVLPWIFIFSAPLLVHPWFDLLLRIVFLVLSFLSGLLVGAEFPLANREYMKMSGDLGGTAGLLYSADLWGGWIGGILGGVVLLPVLGLVQTSLVIVMFKVSGLAMLMFAVRRSSKAGSATL